MIYGLILLASDVLGNYEFIDNRAIFSSEENWLDGFCSFCSESASGYNEFCIPCRQAVPWCSKCDCYSDTCFQCEDPWIIHNGTCSYEGSSTETGESEDRWLYDEEIEFIQEGWMTQERHSFLEIEKEPNACDESKAMWNVELSQPHNIDSWISW